MRLLFICAALVFADNETQSDEVAPTPAPPPVKKSSPTPSTTPATSTDTSHDHEASRLQAKVDAALRSLETTGGGGGYKVGAWLYADYKQDGTADSAAECATSCESDSGCFHWNFHVDNSHCDLKNNNGGYYSNDHTAWVTGNARRTGKSGDL